MKPDGEEFVFRTSAYDTETLRVIANAISSWTYDENASSHSECQKLSRRLYHVVGKRYGSVKITEVV